MLGGVFGGFVNDTSAWGWRLAFLVQVPIVLVSAVLVFFLVKIPPNISNRSYLARIDFTGAFLLVAFLLLLLLGLNAGGNLVPWTHPLVLTSIPLSVVMVGGFIWWENRTRLPIIPVKLLLHRTVLTACLTNLVTTMVVLSAVFYVPLYMQVLGATPTKAALRILGSPLGVSVGSVGSGLIMRRTGKYIVLGICLLLAFIAGVVVLTTLDEKSWSWLPFIAMILAGGGYGGMLTVTLLACIAAVDHSQQAVITSATYAFRSVGSTVGITVSSAVYQNVLNTRLWERFGHLPGAAEEIAKIRNDLDQLNHLPEGWKDGVISSFMEAFKGVWQTNLALAIIGLISISLMKQHTLHSNLARRED
jgi:MFS family permease